MSGDNTVVPCHLFRPISLYKERVINPLEKCLRFLFKICSILSLIMQRSTVCTTKGVSIYRTKEALSQRWQDWPWTITFHYSVYHRWARKRERGKRKCLAGKYRSNFFRPYFFLMCSDGRSLQVSPSHTGVARRV